MKAKSIISTSIASKIEKFYIFINDNILAKLYVFDLAEHEFQLFKSGYWSRFRITVAWSNGFLFIFDTAVF